MHGHQRGFRTPAQVRQHRRRVDLQPGIAVPHKKVILKHPGVQREAQGAGRSQQAFARVDMHHVHAPARPLVDKCSDLVT